MIETNHAPRRIQLIANPVAGGDALAKIKQAQVCLAEQGDRVELFLTGARNDAKSAAREAKSAGFDLIVAAGGDGTLNEVINGLVPSAIPLAFIPLGTTNVFALEAGIPLDIPGACRVALTGAPTPVCLGRAGDARFLLMAGAGFDAEVVRRVDPRLKRYLGKLAYVIGALRVFFGPPTSPIEVELEDGSLLTGGTVVIGNGRFYGGRFSVTPNASLFAAELEVCLLPNAGRLSLLHSLVRMILHRPLFVAGARLFKARHITLRGAGVPVQLDGDFHGVLPLDFHSAPDELTMVMPLSPLPKTRRQPAAAALMVS